MLGLQHLFPHYRRMDDLVEVELLATYKSRDVWHQSVACNRMLNIYLVDILIERRALSAPPSANSSGLRHDKLPTSNAVLHALPLNSPVMVEEFLVKRMAKLLGC